MRLSRSLGLSALLAAAFFCGVLFQQYGLPAMTKTTYFKLEEPLLLQAEGEARDFHMLPPGTALYKDQSFPEGHTRYIVYLNIKGDIAAEKIDSDKPNLIDPVWAYPVQREDVPRLLAETPVSKDELVRILKARRMTREELAQIVREWQD